MMRAMYGCALLCTMLSCDNSPRSQAERRFDALEYRVAMLEQKTRRHVEAETATRTAAAKPIVNRCPNPIDGGWYGHQRPALHVSDPPPGLPEFRIYWGLNREHECLPVASPCRAQGVPAERTSASLRACGYPSYSSWATLLTGLLDTFVVEPQIYPNEPDVNEAYGLLQAGNSAVREYTTWTDDLRTRVFPQIISSRRLGGLLYDWAMPHVKDAWRQLSPTDQRVYLGILEHGQRYLATYNHRRELAYLQRLKRGDCDVPRWWLRWYSDNDGDGVDDDGNGQADEDVGHVYSKMECIDEFMRSGPDGADTPYRKLEAFFFRRAQQGVKVADMRYWLDRVVAELHPLTPAEATAAK